MGVVRGRSVHCGVPFVVVVFVQDHWIHWGAPWESLGSFGVARFIGVRPVGRRFFSGVCGYIDKRPWGRRIHSASLGTLGCALVVVQFVWGRWVDWGAPWE